MASVGRVSLRAAFFCFHRQVAFSSKIGLCKELRSAVPMSHVMYYSMFIVERLYSFVCFVCGSEARAELSYFEFIKRFFI